MFQHACKTRRHRRQRRDWFYCSGRSAVKQAVGKAVGDAKLEFEGQADKVEGKVQNAIGGLKDLRQ